MNTKVKLHLGCFNKPIHGFTNVDIRPEVEPDLVDDVFKLEKIENNSVDLIVITHVMEHGGREEVKWALRRYHQVLKNGGELYISVPDLQAVCEHYCYHKDLRLLENFLYGSQKHPWDFHRHGWDYKTLKEDLQSIGYTNISKYDAFSVPWGYVDSYAKSYLPHLDFVNGKLMSLNIKCNK